MPGKIKHLAKLKSLTHLGVLNPAYGPNGLYSNVTTAEIIIGITLSEKRSVRPSGQGL